MGVKTETVTTHTCDRCKGSWVGPMHGDQEHLTRSVTRVSYNGDVGGSSRELWLCGDCSHDLDNFMNGPKVKSS